MFRYRTIIERLAAEPPAALRDGLEARVVSHPRCPVARYLLGCHWFDRGAAATAVRHLMVAHRVEPQYQSAALLVFAGLNWAAATERPLLPVLLETWEEFRRPGFDRYPRERQLLDAFHEPDPGPTPFGPLARRLWRLPIRGLRGQIREAIVSRDAGLYPILAAPA